VWLGESWGDEVRVVVVPLSLSIFSADICRCEVQGQWLLEEEGMEENGPRHLSWPVFVTHWMGLPFHGSPLMVLPPQLRRPARRSRPHPSGKGRGSCGCGYGWRWCPSPHPSKEGRGFLTGSCMCSGER